MLLLLVNFSLPAAGPQASDNIPQPANQWHSPPADWLQVLYAPQYFDVWTSPGGDFLLLADPVLYPPLAELAAPMHKLAGMRVNPANNGFQGEHGGTSPRLVRVENGATIPLQLPQGAELMDVEWTADGRRFALTVRLSDRIGLWTGSTRGDLAMVGGRRPQFAAGRRRHLASRPEAAAAPRHP